MLSLHPISLLLLLPILLHSPFIYVLATVDFPLSLTQDGDYVYTSNVAGCVKNSGPSIVANWTSKDYYKFCGIGWAVGTNRTINYNATFSVSGNSIFSIYGWTRNPYVEYNIIQGQGTYVATGATLKGQVTCNNQPYEILQSTSYATTLPGLDGVTPFVQYWSRKRNGGFGNPLPGPVDMACHFKAWESFGMHLGVHDFQLVGLEAYFSSLNGSVTLR